MSALGLEPKNQSKKKQCNSNSLILDICLNLELLKRIILKLIKNDTLFIRTQFKMIKNFKTI